jgi:hypothetical protein
MLRCGDSLWAAAVRISEGEDDVCSSVFSSFNVAVGGRLEQLNLNTEAQSVCSRCEVSGVVIFRLELVIIPRWFLSEVVVRAVCTLTTTSMLSVAVGCVDVGAQLVLVASSSVVCGVGFGSCCCPW